MNSMKRQNRCLTGSKCIFTGSSVYLSDGNILECSDDNSIFRRKAGQEQTIKLNKSDFKKYVQSKTEVSDFYAS